MSELDALGKTLREELGAPPPKWEEAQLRRLQREGARPTHGASRRFAPVLAVASALAIGVFFIGFWRDGDASNQWLDASSAAVPYAAPDGSRIDLDVGSRGRFTTDEAGSRFDLHAGRATFAVTKRPDQDWTVVAGRYSLHVIGTRFRVSYDQDDLGVWVDEGRVAVRVPQRTEPVVLEAGDHFAAKGDQLRFEARHDASLEPHAANDPGERNSERGTNTGDGADPDGPHDGAAADGPAADGAAPTTSSNGANGAAAATSPAATKDDAAQDWHALYVLGRYEESLAQAKRVGFDALTARIDATRLLALSDAARLGGDSAASLAALRALESRFASQAVAMDSDFLIGRLQAQRGESGAAKDRLGRYLARGDGSRYSLEALGRLLELHAKSGDREQARDLARRYLERAPNGPYQRLATSVLEQR